MAFLIPIAVTALGLTGVAAAVATVAIGTVLTIGVSKLISNRTNTAAAGTQDSGARVQLPPATDNKVPIVYGTAYVAPIITDAKISVDQKYMWYVCTLAEVTNGSGYTFGDIYYSGKKVIFDGTDTAKVNSLETNSDPVQIDDKVAGKIKIWKFPNGSSSGISTGGSNAITLMSDSSTGGGIPANLRWNSALYTDGGQSASMTNLAFLIVRIEFNQDAGVTGEPQLNIQLTNSLNSPGEVLLDYMANIAYGCAIPTDNIDTASLTNLDVYSSELITYEPVGGGSATQARYTINGPVNTGINCLDNLQQLVDACDSWLQYSELTGKWKVVINREWDWVASGPPPAITTLYQVTNENLIGGIDINPIDLNNTYNRLEVQYPNTNIRDQTDFRIIELVDYVPEVMSINEPINSLTVQYPQVNNYIQSLYLGVRRLLQSREELTINLTLDYSGIQIEAGDVIAVQAEQYGWETFNSGYGKLFRVSQVREAKLEDGSLGAQLTAFEYNELVYADNALVDFVPEANTGLSDPNIISKPTKPVVTLVPTTANNSTSTFTVASNVSATGSVLYMDFNYGNSSNTQQHVRYTTVNTADGAPWVANTTVIIDVADLPASNLYWSSTARNDSAGRTSDASDIFSWTGPSINSPTGNGGTGPGGITGNTIQSNTITLTNFNKNLNILEGFGGTNFSIANIAGNTVTMPINAAANTTRNVPIYIIGTSVSTNNYYPWYQGTSSNGSGSFGNTYYANSSTSSFNPAGASLLGIADGEDNWYTAIFDDFPINTIGANQTYFMNYGVTLVSDTANSIVQVVPGLEFSNAGFYQAGTDALHTITLQANLPQVYGASFTASGSTAPNLTSSTLLIRCVTSGANVIVVKGSLTSSKGQTPYY